MAVRNNDQLQLFFPDWDLDDRVINWLWLVLRDEGAELHVDDFGTPSMWDSMAYFISHNRGLINEMEDAKSRFFIPEHDLKWIEKTGRQPTWLLRRYLQNSDNRAPRCPVYLNPRQKLVALLDYSNSTIFDKQSTLDLLRADWVQHQVDDRCFNWYGSGDKEKQKCQIAWCWYQDNRRRAATYVEKFIKLEDVLVFLDGTHFSLDEKRYHLEQIKKKFKAHQTQANREGKKQTNISLSDNARLQLDRLAKKEKRTKTEVIELLIQNAHEHGMPY